jgi:hypothetical protein
MAAASRLPRNLRKQALRSVLCALGVLLSACVSVQKRVPAISGAPGSAEGQWRAQALVRDLKAKKSNELSLEIVAVEPSRMRIEAVSSGLGVYLASLVLNGDEMRVLLARERRFISSRADREALHALVPLRISPHALMDLLFARKLDEREWSCELAEGNARGTCKLRGESLSVTWNPLNLGRRLFEISSPGASVSLVVEDSPAKVEIKPDMFKLNAPDGYRVEAL